MMKRVKATAYYLLVQVSVAFLLYAGVFRGVAGARNVLSVWVWTTLVMAVLALFVNLKAKQYERQNLFPRSACIAWSCALSGVLIWQGWIAHGVAVMLTSGLIAGMEAIEKQKPAP